MSTQREIAEREGRTLNNDAIGFYKMNLAKNAPDVGAVIYIPCPIEMHPEFWNYLDRPWRVCAQINGREVEVWRIGISLSVPISQAEYEFLIADRAWAKAHEPEAPEANPYRAVAKTTKKQAVVAKPPHVDIRTIPIENFMP